MRPPSHSQSERTLQSQLLQRIHTARLQQLADNPVRLLQAPLQQNNTAPLLAKRNSRRTSDDARAHNHNICLVVHAPPLLAVV